MLEARAIDKRLGGRAVLRAASFALEAPGVTAIVGPNGCGKTTLLRAVAGVLRPDAGEVVVDGEPVERPAARRRLGYAPEAADLPPLTVGELAALTAALKGAAAPPAALVARLGLDACRDRPFSALSLGQRRRTCLLLALTGDPPWLVLDDPTAGLDAPGARLLVGLLRERTAAGGGALLATHDRAFADEVGARVLRLEQGRIRE